MELRPEGELPRLLAADDEGARDARVDQFGQKRVYRPAQELGFYRSSGEPDKAWACTGGYVLRINGTPFGLTAGHCSRYPLVPPGGAWETEFAERQDLFLGHRVFFGRGDLCYTPIQTVLDAFGAPVPHRRRHDLGSELTARTDGMKPVVLRLRGRRRHQARDPKSQEVLSCVNATWARGAGQPRPRGN